MRWLYIRALQVYICAEMHFNYAGTSVDICRLGFPKRSAQKSHRPTHWVHGMAAIDALLN